MGEREGGGGTQGEMGIRGRERERERQRERKGEGE
jgi:hypothetical protein